MPVPQKALAPILVTLLGIVMFVRLLQSENVSSLITVRLFGSVILVRPLQPVKAPLPMLVTLSGMVISVRLLQL